MIHSATMFLPEHPLRRALLDELHMRRLPHISAPARLLQIIMVSGEDGYDADRVCAEKLCLCLGMAPSSGKHFVAAGEGLSFIWERHTEFTSYTFIWPGPVNGLFDEDLLVRLPEGWLHTMPGVVLRARQIVILGPGDPEPPPEVIATQFIDSNVVSCFVANAGARIWSDVRVYPDGLGRLLVHNRTLEPGDLSRLVQQLQELGNYRNMALLGLLTAQAETPNLLGLERRLSYLVKQITLTTESRDSDDTLLSELSGFAAELVVLTTHTAYRMSATEAYAELVKERLGAIGAERIPGYETLAEFTERRLLPGVRTCRSFTRRLQDLSARTDSANALLRTRVETMVERQSRDLLKSMNRRTALQLRLQQTVEGFSVMAVSYYAVGLMGYVFHGVQAALPALNATLITGVAVPVVVLAVVAMLRRVTAHLH